MFTVIEFCGPCSLRTGAILIGIYDLIFKVFDTFDFVLELAIDLQRETFSVGDIVLDSIHIIICALKFTACLILLYGAKKGYPKLLIPWMAITALEMVEAIVIPAGNAFYHLTFMSKWHAGEIVVENLIIVVLKISVLLYCWLAVYSLYKSHVVLRRGVTEVAGAQDTSANTPYNKFSEVTE